MFTYQSVDHVQLACPKNGEEEARLFYQGILGLEEIPKPKALRKNGGVWFQAGSVQLHIGTEEPFTAAKKAHPGIAVDDLIAMKAYLDEQSIEYTVDKNIPEVHRIHVYDTFGNRLEFLEHV